MTVENLPDRPLASAEVTEIASVEGVEGVVPVVREAGTGRVVCFVVGMGDAFVTLGWRPGGEGWEVIDRRER